MPAHSALITVMERAARKAGSRLRRDFGEIEHLQVSKRGPSDFVSKADMRSERILYDELLKVRPGWGFVLEEGGMIEGEEGKPRWIIDPLDGSTNFLHGIPHFAISIAVQERSLDGKGWGKITSGLIYEPVSDQTWWAELDRGAYLGDKRLRVSAGGICRRRLLPPVFLLQGIVNLANGRVFLVRSRLKWRVSAAMAQRRLTLPGWLRVVLTDFGKRGFTFGMWLPVF